MIPWGDEEDEPAPPSKGEVWLAVLLIVLVYGVLAPVAWVDESVHPPQTLAQRLGLGNR